MSSDVLETRAHAATELNRLVKVPGCRHFEACTAHSSPKICEDSCSASYRLSLHDGTEDRLPVECWSDDGGRMTEDEARAAAPTAPGVAASADACGLEQYRIRDDARGSIDQAISVHLP